MASPTKIATAQRVARRSVRISRAEAQLNPIPATLGQHQHAREDELRITVLGGIGPTFFRELQKKAGFPKPVRLSPRVLVWHVPSVVAWMEERRLNVEEQQQTRSVVQMPRHAIKRAA
jgi:predicted DNA-binding transcriptional regulator AlpA